MRDDRTINLSGDDEGRTVSSGPGDDRTLASNPADSSAVGIGPDRAAGDRIGPYHLVRIIGEGGMGRVYEAEQFAPLRRRVALKMVKGGMASEEFIARFESERQALAVMDHPCIARVMDAGATEDGQPYFVMEYVEGVPFNEYCDEHQLDLKARLELFGKVCEGVQHAHQKAIIHRDLKPGNVLVTQVDGRPVPKIIDFGVAKIVSEDLMDMALETGLGQLLGTPEYMSPEQANLTTAAVDTTTDVYALGVILYELLVGELPFTSTQLRREGFQECLRIIREVDPPAPTTRLKTMATQDPAKILAVAGRRNTREEALTRALRGDLDWIVMKALEKDMSRRYPTVLALGLDIGSHLQHQPVLAGPPSRSYRMQKFIRRNRVWVAAASLALAAVLLGTAGTTVGMIRAVRAEKHAQQEAQAAREVSDFLVDLFEVSDPDQARGNTITAREILDNGARRVATELVDQPLTQARLMNTIGKVYGNLGLYQEAGEKLEAALTLLRDTPDRNDRVLAAGQADLAEIYISQARYSEAEAMLGEALTLMEDQQWDTDLQAARSLGDLAGVYRRQGRFTEAEALYRRSHEIYVNALGPADPQVASSLNSLAIISYQQGRYDQAEALYKQALELWRRAYGTDHSDLAKGLNNLGLLYHHQDRFDEARPRYEEAAQMYAKILGPRHPRYARSLNNLALLYFEMGRYAEAKPLYERALAIQKEALGADHPEVGRTLNNLANLHRNQGHWDEAEELYRQALNIRRQSLGADHPDVAWTLRDLGLLNFQKGRAEDSLEYFEHALQIYGLALGQDHPDLVEILDEYATAMRAAQHPARADSLTRRARDIARINMD